MTSSTSYDPNAEDRLGNWPEPGHLIRLNRDTRRRYKRQRDWLNALWEINKDFGGNVEDLRTRGKVRARYTAIWEFYNKKIEERKLGKILGSPKSLGDKLCREQQAICNYINIGRRPDEEDEDEDAETGDAETGAAETENAETGDAEMGDARDAAEDNSEEQESKEDIMMLVSSHVTILKDSTEKIEDAIKKLRL